MTGAQKQTRANAGVRENQSPYRILAERRAHAWGNERARLRLRHSEQDAAIKNDPRRKPIDPRRAALKDAWSF